MTVQDFRDYASLAATLLALGTFVFAWVTRGGKEAGEAVKALDKKVDVLSADNRVSFDRIDDRVSKLEFEVKHLPDKDTAHRLEMAVSRLEGQLHVMDERLKPVAAMASRMQEVMLEDRRA
jgi:hypothetical protein